MGHFISYIIPTLNEEASLAETLKSVMAQPGNKEVIIVDGGSIDKTLEIAREIRCQIIESSPGRGVQLNHGADIAKGDILLFLHADTTLPFGASLEVESQLGKPSTIAGSFRLEFKPSSSALRLYSLCTAINNSFFTFGDQGLFLKRSAFYAIGKFKPYPILEDVDFQIRTRRMGRFAKSHLLVTTSSRRFRRHGVIRQQLLNLCIIAAYHAGVQPQKLSQFYSNAR